MKRCSGCKVEKPFEEFSKNRTRKDGFQIRCKSCAKQYKENYYKENKDKLSEYTKQYYQENKDEISEYAKQYRKENKDKISEHAKKYYQENKDKIKQYQEENKDKISEQKKQYYQENKDKIKQYQEENKDLSAARSAKRRAKKLQATPDWLTEEQLEEIKDFYTACKMFQIYTGLTYHVDHIMPLQGETVCGLHVPWNLQILEASENMSKHNRLLEEYLYE